MDEKHIARFWSKVDRNGPTPSHCPEIGPCWVWTGFTLRGYGKVRAGSYGQLAHRVSWRLAFGDAGSKCVLHKCDNRACVRQEHLFLGTNQDNSDDKLAKGRERYVIGSEHGMSKLTESSIIEIRQLYRDGWTKTRIAKRFGITRQNVGFVVRRETWKHVA